MLGTFLSFIGGYFAARECAGKEMGQKGKLPSLKFKVNDYVVHFHHWLNASFILVAFPTTMRGHLYLLFFFVGVIVQGLTYKDFYKVIYRYQPNSELNAQMSFYENART